MKILLVNPNSDFLINAKVFPSLGLLYLSSYLKKYGYDDIALLDMNDEKILPDSIDADIVGFYSNTPQFPATIKIAREIKKRNIADRPSYILGGPHISGKPEDASGKFDAAVVGEGERAFLDIVRRKESSEPYSKIVKYDYIKEIDTIPFPDRDIIDIKSYKYYLDGHLTTTIVTSRGCPFGCRFCANNAWGKSLRMRSPKNVYSEVKTLKERYGYRSFMFFDDTMTVDKRRMARICDLLRELNIIYRCFIRSDTVDKDLLLKMYHSGCREVGVGIESGSQRILDIVNKGETVEKNMEAVKLCHRVGLRVKGFIIVGLPGEDEKSIKETTMFLEEAELDDIDVTVYTPYPGSYVYKNKEEFDIKFQDDYERAWFKGKPGHYKSLVSTAAFGSEDIIGLRDSIESKYKKAEFAHTLSYNKAKSS